MPQRQQRRSRKQEAQGAERFGGKVTPGSGAGWVVKNDVKTDRLSIEYKYTDKKSFSLKYADLAKAAKNALLDSGREFAFIVGFGKVNGQSMTVEDEYVVISRPYFEELINGHSE